MSTALVLSVYLAALAAAVFLLYRFSHHSWIWHAVAALGALAVGLTPPPAGWNGPLFDMTVGAVFLFLAIWGVGEFAVRALHLPRHP